MASAIPSFLTIPVKVVDSNAKEKDYRWWEFVLAKVKNRSGLKSKQKDLEKIEVDPNKNLIFESEKELFQHFQSEIVALEEVFYKHYDETNDIAEENYAEFEDLLLDTLANPDFIYQSDIINDKQVQHFCKVYDNNETRLYYIAVAYIANEEPTFVFLHFPTQSEEIYEAFSKGEILYDAIKDYEEGDALADGDELAVGLYSAMLKIRSDKDIAENNFNDYKELRDNSIEEPDEIWRAPDLQGNVLVNFIKDHSEAEKDLFYVSVAVEDKTSDSHILLFSFPTNDKSLVERYRRGESLLSDEESLSDDSH